MPTVHPDGSSERLALEIQLDDQHYKTFLYDHLEQEKRKFGYLFNIAYKSNHDAVACLRTAKIYKVDQETSNIEDDNLDPALWPQIEEADHNEVKQFVDEKAFSRSTRCR